MHTTKHLCGRPSLRWHRLASPAIVFLFGFVVVPNLHAATMNVLVDTPTAFRADFTGIDTVPNSVGDGNDFQIFVFKFWTVLVNLRGDATGPGGADGFYEIQLTHSGSAIPNPGAPVVNTSLIYSGAQSGTVQTDSQVSSQPHLSGTETLATTVTILYDQGLDVVLFSGSIAGSSDLDGNSQPDQIPTKDLAHLLNDLKKDGTITGQQKGETMKQSNKKIK